jgi:hypothetical protein
MPNLMLSWQQAALLALGLGGAGVLLVYTGHAAGRISRGGRTGRAMRWAGWAGPFLRESGLVIALYALWQLAGNLSAGGFSGAVDHAWRIWHTERAIGLLSELDVQRLLLPHPLLSEISNLYYATMHFGMLVAVLIWLFARHRDGYPAVRNAIAASTAICLLISFIPVAPPRMLTSLGIVDLPARYGQSVYDAVGSAAGADQLSAMPSVHVAWAVLVAWAVITRGAGRWRWLILLHPAATVFVVVATGNHFWADGIVAAAIVAVVLALQAVVDPRAIAAHLPRRASAGRTDAAAEGRPRAAQHARSLVPPLTGQSGWRPETQRHAPAAGRRTADGQRSAGLLRDAPGDVQAKTGRAAAGPAAPYRAG